MACFVRQQERQSHIEKLGGLGASLATIDQAVAQGSWREPPRVFGAGVGARLRSLHMMQLSTTPHLSPAELAAIERLLANVDPASELKPESARTRWSEAAAHEAVDCDVPSGYARSPRSTPGATRA